MSSPPETLPSKLMLKGKAASKAAMELEDNIGESNSPREHRASPLKATVEEEIHMPDQPGSSVEAKAEEPPKRLPDVDEELPPPLWIREHQNIGSSQSGIILPTQISKKSKSKGKKGRKTVLSNPVPPPPSAPPLASSFAGVAGPSFVPSDTDESIQDEPPGITINTPTFTTPLPNLVSGSLYYKPASTFVNRYPVTSLTVSEPISSVLSQNAALTKEREQIRKREEELAKQAAQAKAAAESENKAQEEHSKRVIEERIKKLSLNVEQFRQDADHSETKPTTTEAAKKMNENDAQPDSKDNEPSITLEDAIGRKFVFPWQLCNSWKVMEALICQAFLHVEHLGDEVLKGHYDLINSDETYILPQIWEFVVQPGSKIRMLMWPMKDPSPPLSPFSPLVPPIPASRPIDTASHFLDKKIKIGRSNLGSIRKRPLGNVASPKEETPAETLEEGQDVHAEYPRRNEKPIWSDTAAPPPPPGFAWMSFGSQPYVSMVNHMAIHHMPHLKLVKGDGFRHQNAGSIFCYDMLDSGGAPRLIKHLKCNEFNGWKEASKAVHKLRPTRSRRIRRRTIIVEDLSPNLIEALGSSFHMNPEFFEEHLNRSGYRSKSYDDPLPRTWSTTGTPKDYISVRWYRPVHRSKEFHFSDNNRNELISTDEGFSGLKYIVRSGKSTTVNLETNIFRGEWLLTASPINTHASTRTEDARNKAVTERRDEDEKTFPAAWEERATIYKTDVHGCSVVIILLDPLPKLSYSKLGAEKTVLPFQGAYSRGPFGPKLGMVGIFASGAKLYEKLTKLGPYLKDTKSTKDDLTHWIGEVEVFSPKETELDPMIGLLWVLHRDITGFLTQVSNVLVEIGISSADDYLMQSRLSHWRSLIIRFQIELPEIKASLDAFVRFVCEYQSLEIAAPFIKDTLAQIDILIIQNEKSYAALRDDMSLLENKRAIAQAESVNRLTELGFIFIPISCVAGIFSMQIEQFVNPVPLRSFIIGAVVAVCAAYFIRLTLHGFRMAKLKSDHYKKIEEREDLLPNKSISTHLGPQLILPDWLHSLHVSWPNYSSSSRRDASYLTNSIMVLLFIAILMLPILLVWTHKHLDSGFKSALTVLIFALNFLVMLTFRLFFYNRRSWNINGTVSPSIMTTTSSFSG